MAFPLFKLILFYTVIISFHLRLTPFEKFQTTWISDYLTLKVVATMTVTIYLHRGAVQTISATLIDNKTVTCN